MRVFVPVIKKKAPALDGTGFDAGFGFGFAGRAQGEPAPAASVVDAGDSYLHGMARPIAAAARTMHPCSQVLIPISCSNSALKPTRFQRAAYFGR